MNGVIENGLDAVGFNVDTGYFLACASNFAYEQNVGRWTEKLGLGQNVTFFTCGQFHGFVGILDKIVLLAFRGTQSVANCLTDVETALVSRPPYTGRVHSGFAGAVEEVWPTVRELVSPASRSRSLLITGHSLGGAMATLASVRFANAGYSVRAVYTYGSPRVGDRVFRDSYHWPNYRFVCGNDLVPHLPFRWCYKHVGHSRLMDHQGNLSDEDAVWRAKKRSMAHHAKRIQRGCRRKREFHEEHGEFDWLADHHLSRYLDAIGKIVSRLSRRLLAEGTAIGRRIVPERVHRVDAATPGAPQPKSISGQRKKAALTDTDLIAAFSRQRHRPPWQNGQ